MKKEIIWAAAIGIAFGLIIAFGVYRVNSSIKEIQGIQTPSPSPEPNTSDFKITLDKPDSLDVFSESTTTITGITKPLTWVETSADHEDYITESDDRGAFSQKVDLVAGLNQIQVSAFDPTGAKSTQKIMVVYSSLFETKTPSPEASIGAKVAQEISNVVNKPKSYVGVVTDIADSTIQIKSMSSDIEQISVDQEKTTAANTSGVNNKTIKISDVAIGDFIVAMGYVNKDSVLDAERIIVADAPADNPDFSVSYARVSSSSTKSITVKSVKGDQEYDIKPTSKTDVFAYKEGQMVNSKVSNIENGDFIIYVEIPSLKTLFLLTNPQGS